MLTSSRARSGFHDGDIAWFLNGKLNVSYNCIDRHLASKGEQTAIIWEGDEPGDVRHVTYNELYKETCRVANLMKSVGIRKGDTVCIYMPNSPETVYVMLACARIGAPHTVVFAGFSSESLSSRINDCKARLVFTCNENIRGGRVVSLKRTVDEAVQHCPSVEKVFVLMKTDTQVHMQPNRDFDLREQMDLHRPYCAPEWLDSEDMLFLLYTSGSTGAPKGMVHTQAGYLLYAAMTHKLVFDYRNGDIYACMADVGWITGHSYIVYGPLCNGATTFMFDAMPTYPDSYRYWQCVQRHRITQFYTAPTAIRALMRFPTEPIAHYDLSSLRVLGSVGEPINPEAWRWYFEHVGRKNCAIVDTYWQTESGGHLIAPLPGCTDMKPGSGTFPFFGIELELRHAEDASVVQGNSVTGVLTITKPWPGIARTVFGNHQRYLNTYMRTYKDCYFTGDGATRDHDGFYWIEGRVDDVISVSGHRLGTAEIESALVSHPACAEAAVVGVPHDIKGQTIFAYCLLKQHYNADVDTIAQLKMEVRSRVGAFAQPEFILCVKALPKTRSGKIMRRVLRKIACGEHDQLGDVTTLAEPEVVAALITAVAQMKNKVIS